jgi:hypothetical protein
MNEQEFIDLDRKLFQRLGYGSLGPITLVLKDGTLIAGEAKGIARGSTDGPGPVRYWGRILITAGGEDVEVTYSDIADVA